MRCPECETDLDGGLIYDTFIKMYNGDKEKALRVAEHYGATETEGRWGRQIGHSDGDSVYEWMCPDCGAIWPRRVR